jgi:hypothetical protein
LLYALSNRDRYVQQQDWWQYINVYHSDSNPGSFDGKFRQQRLWYSCVLERKSEGWFVNTIKRSMQIHHPHAMDVEYDFVLWSLRN